MKIVVLGGTGLLGKELHKLDSNLICSGHEVNIFKYKEVYDYLNFIKPDIVVNAAAITNSIEVAQNPIPAIEVNIIGAANVAKYCQQYNKRLVYISTDYVYLGTGNHTEIDPLYPNNEYAWTKLGGECSTRLVNNHLIIRTSFGPLEFPYKKAFKNLWVSKDYVDIIAPKILKAIKSNSTGVLNIGTERKNMYIYASKYNKVEKDYLSVEKDFSLNLNLYNELFNN
jgi:dTDP-4-dehydrorhamnose reductase